jgi:hypothetical protein
MRRDGDLLIDHLSRASKAVLLCAPFIKQGVAKRLLAAIQPDVAVEIVTRWHADEVAAGVSDLEVFEIAAARPGTTLRLLDNLHAKLYLADEAPLVGSANLTATALGWCENPNLELLVPIPSDDEALARCRAELASARLATQQERTAIQAAADAIERVPMPEGQPVQEALAVPWLPRLGAPERLFAAYMPAARERLTASALEAADHDLQALNIPAGLDEGAFRALVADRFSTMPAIVKVLEAAEGDLTDTSAADLIQAIAGPSDLSASVQWQIVREWMTYFLRERYEIAPQSFVTRRRPGTRRP